MKVLFDHQIFLAQKHGGISRYFVELAKNFPSENNSVDIFSPLYINEYLHHLNQPNVKIHGMYINKIPRFKGIISEMSCMLNSKYLSCKDYDIFHETYYSKKQTKELKQPLITTIHDMIHELYPESFLKSDRTAFHKKEATKRADRIIAISNSTKRDLINILGVDENKIDVIYHGCTLPKVQDVISLDIPPYILYVGARGGYKNFKRVLKSYSASKLLCENFDLICFGGGSWTKEETIMISSLKIESKVKLILGDDAKLVGLYKNARCLVYPSLYEGFGFPPLEAMAHGCPSVVSNASSMPEVCEKAAIYFNPEDVEDMRDKIQKVCFDEEVRKKVIDEGVIQVSKFSWEKCADETLQTYRKALR